MKIVDYHIIEENIKRIKKNNELCLVLKNDAYGFKIEKVLPIALKCKVNEFAVIDIKEAVKIRKMSSRSKILLLEFNYDFDTIKKYNLTLSVSNLNELKVVEDNNLKCDISIDIGMNRFGFRTINDYLINHRSVNEFYIHFPYIDKRLLKKANDIALQINNRKPLHLGGSIIYNHK